MNGLNGTGKTGPRPLTWTPSIKGAHHLSCGQVVPAKADSVRLGELKDSIMRGFARQGYTGFSLAIDNYFDPFSVYFTVQDDNGNLKAVARLTEKTAHNQLSLEQGFRRDGGGLYLLDETVRVGDVNSFVFTDQAALPPLFTALAKYALDHGIQKGFCLLDKDSRRFRRIYQGAGFHLSAKYPSPIYFPDFGRTVHRVFKPADWLIMEIDHSQIVSHSRLARLFVNP